MSDAKHVVFVCTGNTCRSPMAEALLRKAVGGREDFRVGSAGVAAAKGAQASHETQTVLRKRDAALADFASRPVSEAILREATHVFAMTQAHLAALEARFPQHADKYYLVREFATTESGPSKDVPDPIGLGLGAYEEVARVLETAVPAIVAYVDATAT